MRRLAATLLALAAAATLAALVFGSSAQGSSASRFDVIFDDARGLISGQLVKIAGAKAGTIQDVVLTPDFKARIEATVDSRFMPFHQDATCTIRPEGLIAENYVDCDPGTANAPPLQASGGHPPTVPVNNTTEPVSLLDLFNMFNLPTRERFAAIIDELGIGTAARGQDFNDVLRRANPALALARQTISILNRQRAQLGAIVDATDKIAAEGATHTASVQAFLDQAAALSTLTADHSSALSQAINRLPGLLAAAQPALQQLDTVAVQGTPVVQQIGAAAPALNRVANDLIPFAKVARPGLADLGRALAKAIPAIRHTNPLVAALRRYADRSLQGTLLVGRLFQNLQQHGFVENFLAVPYYISAALARFDPTSHLLSILLVGAHNGLCGAYSTVPVPGCSAHFGSAPAYKASSALAKRATTRPLFGLRRTGQGAAAPTPSAPPGAPASAGPAPGSTSAPSGTGAVQQTVQTLQNLVGYLLK